MIRERDRQRRSREDRYAEFRNDRSKRICGDCQHPIKIRHRDGDGAYCTTCGQHFDDVEDTTPP